MCFYTHWVSWTKCVWRQRWWSMVRQGPMKLDQTKKSSVSHLLLITKADTWSHLFPPSPMLIPETPKPFKARPLCSSREGEHFELSSLVCSFSAFLSSSKSCLCLLRNDCREASGVGWGRRMSKVILSDWAKLFHTFWFRPLNTWVLLPFSFVPGQLLSGQAASFT